jgi:hypothetical protein
MHSIVPFLIYPYLSPLIMGSSSELGRISRGMLLGQHVPLVDVTSARVLYDEARLDE